MDVDSASVGYVTNFEKSMSMRPIASMMRLGPPVIDVKVSRSVVKPGDVFIQIEAAFLAYRFAGYHHNHSFAGSVRNGSLGLLIIA
jgi:hypothetical protein